MTVRPYLDRIGVLGSVFSALCCLGFPALLSVLSAVGIGFLINDAILLPLLLVFLAISVYGLFSGMKHHGSLWALLLGSVSSVVIVVFLFARFSQGMVQIGIGGLALATLLNTLIRRRQTGSERNDSLTL
ncbi:MAG: MerC domain-containing protein [Chloroflexi bacterium]|nr:MerC domain-containing protein [Chloroflexota bacterium]